MSVAYLPAYEFGEGPIPLRIEEQAGKTFIECDRGDVVLVYLGGREQSGNKCPNRVRIKGVCIPGEACFFELFDQFGRVSSETLEFNCQAVQERLLKFVIWRVQTD